MSVSSSVPRLVLDLIVKVATQLTPWLDFKSNDGLGGGLGFTLLLLLVLGESLVPYPGGLGILLLVVAAEEIDIIVVLSLGLLLWCLGGVDGKLSGLWAVGGVLLGRVTWERGELGLERGDVLVPTVCVRVLGGVGLRLDGLEGLDVGLRRSVASELSVS